MNVSYDITAIEDTLKASIKKMKVSDKVYSNRPHVAVENAQDFIVVKVTGSVEDLGPFGRCTISVSLFAKDVSSMKNGVKLSYMQKTITEKFKGDLGNLLIDTSPRVLGDVADDFGFHARVILFNNVTIKIV